MLIHDASVHCRQAAAGSLDGSNLPLLSGPPDVTFEPATHAWPTQAAAMLPAIDTRQPHARALAHVGNASSCRPALS